MASHRGTERSRLQLILGLAVCVLLCAACGEPASSRPQSVRDPALSWPELAAEDFTTEQRAQSERALQAQRALFSSLSERLMQAMSANGIDGAIDACKMDAPKLAAAVQTDLALEIGRTSFRLRNPSNVPPDWAVGDVEQRRDRPAWRTHADGRMAALLPIRLMGLCVVCHGQESHLAPGVRAALDAQYPDDKAIGFAEGDLRGWFWIVVPPAGP